MDYTDTVIGEEENDDPVLGNYREMDDKEYDEYYEFDNENGMPNPSSASDPYRNINDPGSSYDGAVYV